MNNNRINVYVGDFKVVFMQVNIPQKKTDLSQLARNVKGSFAHLREELVVEVNDLAGDFKKFCAEFKVIEAGGGLIKNDKNEHLFIFRHDKWDLPKGKLNKKESPEQGAVRECEEECGLTDIKLGNLLVHTYHIYLYKNNWALKKTWWYNMHSNQTKLVPQLEEHITKVEWISNADMPGILTNTYSNIKDVLVTAGLA
jgi:ADP-ribose pyrophosphatase YjhB (NUDIX family)